MWTSHWALVSSTQRCIISCVPCSSHMLLELTSGKSKHGLIWQARFCLWPWLSWRLVSIVKIAHACVYWLQTNEH
jgi:hypothetical protein